MAVALGFEAKKFIDIDDELNQMRNRSLAFTVVPLNATDHKVIKSFKITQDDWYQAVILEIVFDDLESPETYKRAKEQMDFALHRGVLGVLFKCPKCPTQLESLASLIKPYLCPLSTKKKSDFVIYIELSVISKDYKDAWLLWNGLRVKLSANEQVKLVLNLKNGYPSREVTERWAGEPVGIIRQTINSSTTRAESALFRSLFNFLKPIAQKRDIALLIDGTGITNSKLIRRCHGLLRPDPSDPFQTNSYIKRICDNPSAPMQPLRDNLVHSEYEIFEEDHTKYCLYYFALVDAMIDRLDLGQASHSSASEDSGLSSGEFSTPEKIDLRPTYAFKKPLTQYEQSWINYEAKELVEPVEILSEDPSRALTVVVAGAGRGPLVTATLLAATVAKVAKITVHVIEKNPNVLECLRNKAHQDWSSMHSNASIFIHPIDMRIEKITEFIPEEVDIVVSELLGSFGDNELSPECLGALLSHLNRDVICIPQSYTSHIQPISAHKGHIKLQKLAAEDGKAPDAYLDSYHSMKFRNYYAPTGTHTAPIWQFNHFPPPTTQPANPYPPDHKMRGECDFTCPLDFLCHGFAGYFTARLYGSITLSTRPEDHTKNMPSWYPVYFPLVKPIFVKAGNRIGFRIKRSIKPDETVGYEWEAFIHDSSDQVSKDAATSAA